MDLTSLTMSRRTVHNYKPIKIDDALVEKALELSLWAPNHKLTFPWAYFWTGPESREKLAALSVELKEAKSGEPLSEIKKKAVREGITNPSHVVVLATRIGDPGRAHEDYATLACSVQIASLFLWEKGIGTKWSTGGNWMSARTYEILGVSSSEFKLEGALLIGVPLMTPPTPERPSLASCLRRFS